MRTVSERWRQAAADVNRWVTEIHWSNTRIPTFDDPTLELVSGTVTCDATSQVRWKADLEVRGPYGPDGLNGFTCQLLIRHGIEFGPGDRELLTLGVYRVDSVDIDGDDSTLLKIGGSSFEQYLIDAKLTHPQLFAGQQAFRRVERLIHEELPDATIDWDQVDSIWIPKIVVERDRWAQIDGNNSDPSIAKSLGARIFCDAGGVFTVRHNSSLEDDPVWSAVEGTGGLLVTSSESLTSEGVYNRVVALGEAGDNNQPAIYGVASDTDPYSPTRVGGRFGRRTKFYSSQYIRSAGQARAVARSQLEPYLGLKQQVSFDSLHDPRKEAGDVGEVTGPDGGIRRVILDSVTYDLLGGPLQAQTRTTATRYSGSFAQVEEVEMD